MKKVEIELTKNKVAIISEEDFDKVSQHKWYATHSGRGKVYAKTYIKGKGVYLHRYIMGLTNSPMRVDHIDGDGLNCTRDNMRIATHKQNLYNVPKIEGCSSKYKGVHWSKVSKKWAVMIKGFNNRHVGFYEDEIEAARVYDRVAIEIHKEFAYLNFPDDIETTLLVKYPTRYSPTSIYTGVSKYKYGNKWVAAIRKDKKSYSLGYFKSEKEAAKAYDLKSLELYGENAHLNFPELREEYLNKLKDKHE